MRYSSHRTNCLVVYTGSRAGHTYNHARRLVKDALIELAAKAAPLGIISYELAGTVEEAQAILDSWDSSAQLHAAFALGFDYVFMLAYSTTIGLACVMAAGALRSRDWPLAGVGAGLAWGQWLAASLDAVENIALTAMLFGAVASPWPQVAYWCALVKFALVFLGLVYAFYGGVVGLFIRKTPAR